MSLRWSFLESQRDVIFIEDEMFIDIATKPHRGEIYNGNQKTCRHAEAFVNHLQNPSNVCSPTFRNYRIKFNIKWKKNQTNIT